MKIIRLALLLSLLLVFGARADVAGFGGNGTGWTLNGVGGDPSIAGDVLTATQTGVFDNATSAWNNTAQPVTGNWTATFTYNKAANNSNPNNLIAGGAPTPQYADGFTFTIQSAGLNALGGGGGALGYPNGSVGFALKTTDFGNTPSQGFGFFTNSANFNTNNLGTLDLISTNRPITITVTYDGNNHYLTVIATQELNSASTQMGINLTSLFGPGGKGFVGFTGGTGSLNQTTQLSNFNFVTSPLTASPGNYAVLIKDPADPGTTKTTGFVRGTLTSPQQGLAAGGNGNQVGDAFTATVFWQGRPYPVSGALDGNGTLTKTFAAKNKPQRNLTFTMTKHGVLGGIDGTLTDGTLVTPFSSYPPAGKIRTGKITGLLVGNENGNGPTVVASNVGSNEVVLGIGWFKGTVNGDNSVSYNGRMPDGRRFSGSSFVNNNGGFAAYNAFPRYDGLGSFFGAIGLSSRGVSVDFMRLERPPSHTARYGEGFNTAFPVLCAYYFTPPADQPIVRFFGGSPNVNLNIFNGNLANTTTPVTYSGADKFVFAGNPLKYKFKTDRANGLFTATFQHPTQGQKKITGAFVQRFDPNDDLRGGIGNSLSESGIVGGVFKGGLLAGGLIFGPLSPP